MFTSNNMRALVVLATLLSHVPALAHSRLPKCDVMKDNRILGLHGQGPNDRIHALEFDTQGPAVFLMVYAGPSALSPLVARVKIDPRIRRAILGDTLSFLNGRVVEDKALGTRVSFSLSGVDRAQRPRIDIDVETRTRSLKIERCLTWRRREAYSVY